MSAQKSTRKQRPSQQSTQSSLQQLPQDIHSSAMSPGPSTLSAKAQALSNMSAQLSQTHADRLRRIQAQTIGRDPNSKLSAQRSTSRGANLRGDLRQLRTDRRPTMDDSMYARPEGHLSQEREGEEAKEEALVAAYAQQAVKYGGGQNTAGASSAAANTLRDSHESMRTIQKQRIQRSLQKSQEGRKKLEEKLEAISSRDRQLYGQTAASLTQDNRSQEQEKNESNPQRYESSQSTGGSLLATKGGFHNLRNKDQIKDQMLASISKIKSFRETGEFDIAQQEAQAAQNLSGEGIAHDYRPRAHHTNPNRTSDQVLLAEPPFDNLQQPRKVYAEDQQPERHEEAFDGYSHQNHTQDNYSNLSSLQNFQSTQSAKTTIRNQIHMINQQMADKVCENIEDAQPYLKTCLTSVGGNALGSTQGTVSAALQNLHIGHESEQFTSILSSGNDSMELDKNLICPRCSYIVVHPVECQSCQYIICYKCAQASQGVCEEDQCGEKFTTTPGKVHKLYKEMLNQLEFRCPNQAQGCSKILRYDVLDHHLKKGCEARMQMCPNRCSKTKKFGLAQLQQHIDEDCPKECVPCPRCKQIKYRNEIEEHLEGSCDKVIVKCPHCDLEDLRISFRMGKHDCENQPGAFEGVAALRGSQDKNRDKGIRNYDEISRKNKGDRSQKEPSDFDVGRSEQMASETYLTGPVTQAQVRIVKDEIQNIQNLITVDIFQMIDTFSKALTEKENEVEELKKVNKQTKRELSEMASFNLHLEGMLTQDSKKISQIQNQMAQQTESNDEMISNFTVKSLEQTQKVEDLQNLVLKTSSEHERRSEQYEDKIKNLNHNFITQANKHAEIMAKLSIKQEQNNNLISSHEGFMKQLSQNTQNQLNRISEANQGKAARIEELENTVEGLSGQLKDQSKSVEEMLKGVTQQFESRLKQIDSKQTRQQLENDQFQQFVIESVKARQPPQETGHSTQDQVSAQLLPAPQNPPERHLGDSRKVGSGESQEEQKLQESQVEESLDEEILAMHYAKQQEDILNSQSKFQRHLKVPPINFQHAAPKAKQQARNRRSPKHQKHYSEDVQNQQLSSGGARVAGFGFGEAEVSSQLNQHYASLPQNERGGDRKLQQPADDDELKSRTQGRPSKGGRAEEGLGDADARRARPSGQGQTQTNQQPEELVEDVDESQFIPAYLSSTENDMTDLNRTELNTEYNTSRPLGGHTDRQSNKGSSRKNQRAPGGLTDRERAGGGVPLSEALSSMSYQISQSTLPRNKKRLGDKGASDGKDDSSLSDDLGRGSPKQQRFDESGAEQPPGSYAAARQQQQKKHEDYAVKSNNSFVNESEPELGPQEKTNGNLRAGEFDLASEPRLATNVVMQAEERKSIVSIDPGRRSIPRPSLQPYNENFMQTYESSEFEQQSPDQLPGMIFGQGQRQPERSQGPPKELIASQLSHKSKKTSMMIGQSPQNSDEKSLGNLQVNLDLTLSQFYAMANKDSSLKLQSPGQENNINATQLDARVSSNIHQEPYSANSLLCQSVKLDKSSSERFPDLEDDQTQSRQIEHEIQKLASKYSLSTQELNQKLTGGELTEQQLVQALKNIDQAGQNRKSNASNKKRQGQRKSTSRGKKGSVKRRESSNSFERDEANGSESIDNIIHSILEGDDLFKSKKKAGKQVAAHDVRKISSEQSGPFEIIKQESRSSVNSNPTQGEIDKIIKKANRSDSDEGSHREGESDYDPSHPEGDDQCLQDEDGHQVLPTGLESDLETILETDQESNYMTTARTTGLQNLSTTQTNKASAQLGSQYESKNSKSNNSVGNEISNRSGQLLDKQAISGAYVAEAPDENGTGFVQQEMEASNNDLFLNQSLMNQSLNSLNNSSFVQLEGGALYSLPATLFGASEAPPSRPAEKDQHQEYEQPPQTVRKDRHSSGAPNLNQLLNEISPISRDIDRSHLLQTRYSNILNSEKSAHSAKLNMDDICIELRDESPRKLVSSGAMVGLQDVNQEQKGGDGQQQLECIAEEQDQSFSQLSADLPKNLYVPEGRQREDYSNPYLKPAHHQALMQPELLDQIVPEKDLGLEPVFEEEKEGGEDLEEQRIRQYHNKVLWAISDSAKKKQQEQKDIMKAIELSVQHKSGSEAGETATKGGGMTPGGPPASRNLLRDESPQPMSKSAQALGPAKGFSEEFIGLVSQDALDRDSIEKELQQIIKRNRQIYENKLEQRDQEEGQNSDGEN